MIDVLVLDGMEKKFSERGNGKMLDVAFSYILFRLKGGPSDLGKEILQKY